MKRAVVIVAGGSGIRMGGDLPKQYQELAGIPLIVHSLEKFRLFDPSMVVVMVMSPAHIRYWESIRDSYKPDSGIIVAHGGKSRFESVKNGLDHVEDGMVVGIHDAVRPLVSQGTLDRTYSSALRWGCGIPVIDMEDSLRMLDEKGDSKPLDRAKIRRVQTPQVFQSTLIKKAYQRFTNPEFTDDASVYESEFGTLKLVDGNRENIKITTPTDLQLAKALIHSGD